MLASKDHLDIKVYKILNVFFLKFHWIFDKIVKIRIFLSDPDPGGQLFTELPDPEQWSQDWHVLGFYNFFLLNIERSVYLKAVPPNVNGLQKQCCGLWRFIAVPVQTLEKFRFRFRFWIQIRNRIHAIFSKNKIVQNHAFLILVVAMFPRQLSSYFLFLYFLYFFIFLTFVFRFLLDPDPNPDPETEFITIPVPLGQKVAIPQTLN